MQIERESGCDDAADVPLVTIAYLSNNSVVIIEGTARIIHTRLWSECACVLYICVYKIRTELVYLRVRFILYRGEFVNIRYIFVSLNLNFWCTYRTSTWITQLIHVGCTREWSARYTMMVLVLASPHYARFSPFEGWRRGCNYAGWKCVTRVPSSFQRCIIHAFYRDLLCFLRFPYSEALWIVIVSIKTLPVIFQYFGYNVHSSLIHKNLACANFSSYEN